MARRMRAHDWSKSALGPVDRWPAALKSTVSTCLDCAFPIVLWWGPELSILYNDEYIDFLGETKHPEALGRPGASVWAEIWDVIEPMLSQVMSRGEPTRSRDLLLHIDRGYPEEAYFSFSYSPIHVEDGSVGGVFCPVIETTDKVIGARRLRTLRDLATRTKGATREDEACLAAATTLAGNPYDVPFALVYRIDDRQGAAELVAAAGIAADTVAAPARVNLDGGDPWAITNVVASGGACLLTDLATRFESLPTGGWKTAPHTALVQPVLLPGHERPATILVTAVSPMRALDSAYRTFFELIATQLAAGLADARAIEEERRRAESLAELDRAKTAFFSNVSHEFRTPLTLMLGPLEELQRQASHLLPDGAAEALATAHRNSLRLLKLVNTLLDFSRIEAGRVDASFEPTDLATLTRELASAFHSAADAAGLRLLIDCAPLPEPIHVDRDMWEKVVLNLLSNALKFTHEGEIRVSLTWQDNTARLQVSDTGIGIPTAELPRMFERFHRVKQDGGRTHEGTGIGLALVRELVTFHGGTATVESLQGHGSVFTVTIPSGTAHLPPERVAAARRLPQASIGATPFVEEAGRWLLASTASRANLAGPRARVLVADDNADMRDYLTRLLAPHYDVDTVADGGAALDHVLADTPDLVLADVMMPVLDGFGLVAGIRRDAAARAVPVILLSARAGEGSQIEGLEAGADQYLVKPFSARDLLARVASQLELGRLRRSAELTIAESERRLREADARKDEFLALLAHELRNPLAPIRTGLELIRLSGDAPDTVRRVRSMIERQVALMVRLIDDLLDVSRITSGKIVLQRRPTALAELVQSAVEAQRAAIEAAHIALTIELPSQPCVVDVDPARVVQIISNVLHNASKFTPAGGRISLGVAVEHRGPAGEPVAAIRVTDTGVGIPQALLGRIFELFTQGEAMSERAQGGLGIGLALAQRLAEMHGGDIVASSEGVGRGSEFVIRLPMSPAAAEGDHRPAVATPRVRSRALIIDDNRDAATTMAMFVEELGGSALTAHDGTNGLAAIEAFHPDIVFMDIGMPGLDGYEVCRRIRQMPSQRSVVLVAVTGWGQAQDKRRALEVGFDAHLTKPVDPDAVAQLLAGAAVGLGP
jgi:signal transduction histidine kinase